MAHSKCRRTSLFLPTFSRKKNGVDDETFEPTGNEGINAERQYGDEDAIVVWPRSMTWIVVTRNELEKMSSYFLENCSDIEDATGKPSLICHRLISELSCHIKKNASQFTDCLIKMKDKGCANFCIGRYMSSPLIVYMPQVVDKLAALFQTFVDGSIRATVLKSITPRLMKNGVNAALKLAAASSDLTHKDPKPFLASFVKSLVAKISLVLSAESVQQFLPFNLQGGLSQNAVRDYIGVLVGPNVAEEGSIACSFLNRWSGFLARTIACATKYGSGLDTKRREGTNDAIECGHLEALFLLWLDRIQKRPRKCRRKAL